MAIRSSERRAASRAERHSRGVHYLWIGNLGFARLSIASRIVILRRSSLRCRWMRFIDDGSIMRRVLLQIAAGEPIHVHRRGCCRGGEGIHAAPRTCGEGQEGLPLGWDKIIARTAKADHDTRRGSQGDPKDGLPPSGNQHSCPVPTTHTTSRVQRMGILQDTARVSVTRHPASYQIHMRDRLSTCKVWSGVKLANWRSAPSAPARAARAPALLGTRPRCSQ